MTFDLEKAKSAYGMPETWPVVTKLGDFTLKPFTSRGEVLKWIEDSKEKGDALHLTRKLTKIDAEDAAQLQSVIVDPVLTEEQVCELVKNCPKLVQILLGELKKMIEELQTAPIKTALSEVEGAKKP